MAHIPFEDYVASLGRLTAKIDPTASTPAADDIMAAVATLDALDGIDAETLTAWVTAHPSQTYVLALVVGLSREKLTNHLRDWFGTGSWQRAAREQGSELVAKLDQEFDLLRLLRTQRGKTYTLGDVLVARAGTRATATSAGQSGRRIEDELESIAQSIDLPYETRTRFAGRNGRTAPADLAVPTGGRACVIAVAAKGFDSTGSKLTDAVREIEEMADVRTGGQVALAVVDGIGWKGRMADLRRIWSLWETGAIDGLYTLATLGQFRTDLDNFAALRGITRTR
jgi:hypothetical protein